MSKRPVDPSPTYRLSVTRESLKNHTYVSTAACYIRLSVVTFAQELSNESSTRSSLDR